MSALDHQSADLAARPARVVVESPYAGDVDANVQYARQCLLHSLVLGEAPYASHLLFTQPGVTDDTVPEQRRLGMERGFVWGAAADATVVYVDRDISAGMWEGISRALEIDHPVEYRTLRARSPRTVPGIR